MRRVDTPMRLGMSVEQVQEDSDGTATSPTEELLEAATRHLLTALAAAVEEAVQSPMALLATVATAISAAAVVEVAMPTEPQGMYALALAAQAAAATSSSYRCKENQ